LLRIIPTATCKCFITVHSRKIQSEWRQTISLMPVAVLALRALSPPNRCQWIAKFTLNRALVGVIAIHRRLVNTAKYLLRAAATIGLSNTIYISQVKFR
ncbi:hypothetical protein LXA36_17945, partial [Erwinia amylovora]|uniref:hypothetical protein n=1 Tax=Erwinia amylovora TaxID=552 RepID=UPI0020BFB8FF